jgi:hypothetical protein
MDTAFTITALIGGTVLAFQFVLMLMGLGDDGSGAVSADHDMSFGGADGGDFSGGLDGDVSGGLHTDAIGGDAMHGDVMGDHTVGEHHAGAPAEHGPFNWFYEVLSLRTLSAALTFFGLTGKMMLAYGHAPWPSFGWASVAGIAAMYGVYWLFRQVFRLQHAGNENVRNAIGQRASVYVPIPGKRAGVGKVTFKLQDRLVEYQAVTEDDERLATGESVVVVAIVNSDTVRVARATATVHA